MAVYGWYCSWDNGASSWKDHDVCCGRSRYWYKDKKEAEKRARSHEYYHKVRKYNRV